MAAVEEANTLVNRCEAQEINENQSKFTKNFLRFDDLAISSKFELRLVYIWRWSISDLTNTEIPYLDVCVTLV